MKRISLLATLSGLALTHSALAQNPTQPAPRPRPKSVELAGKRVVASWPKTNRMPSFVASPDSAHVAWVLARDGVTYLSIDGKEKVLGPAIKIATPQWSRNSKRVALKVWKEIEESQFLDDKIGNWYETVRNGRFTNDNKFGYIGLRAGKWFQVADGFEKLSIESSPDDVRKPDAAVYSSGNSKFLAVKGSKEGKSWFVVNGKKQTEYDGVGDFFISPDGGHYAYVYETKEGVFKKQGYVIDGAAQATFDEAGSGIGQPAWSPDGKTIAYPIKHNGLWFVGQQSLKTNAAPGPLQPYFKPEQSIEEFLKTKPAIATPSLGWHSDIETPIWSSDSKQLGYLAKQDKKMLVVVNRQAGSLYDYISFLTFSPNGKRSAYIAHQGGKQQMIVDGTVEHQFASVYPPMWSPDSNRLAYKVERNSKSLVLVDGQESEDYEKVGVLIWSPDSKHLAYPVMDEDAPAGVADSFEWWKEMKAKQPNFGARLVVDEVATNFIVDPLYDSYPAWSDAKTINVLMTRGTERGVGESEANHYLDALSLKIVD